MKCPKHDWDWDISDPTGCPICYGESLERERIIKLLCHCALDDGQAKHYRCPATTLAHYELIALIKGENK